jgi:branched-chain amino acid transport system substrate-binding protein
VTGYPWYAINTPEHKKFVDAYRKKFNDYPRNGSLVGYSALMSIAAGLKKAGSADSDKLAAAFSGLKVETPVATITYRAQDHQSTLGAFVGRTGVKDGKGIMSSFVYVDGASLQPSDAEVKKLRAAD